LSLDGPSSDFATSPFSVFRSESWSLFSRSIILVHSKNSSVEYSNIASDEVHEEDSTKIIDLENNDQDSDRNTEKGDVAKSDDGPSKDKIQDQNGINSVSLEQCEKHWNRKFLLYLTNLLEIGGHQLNLKQFPVNVHSQLL
jgi:hypothetical protein